GTFHVSRRIGAIHGSELEAFPFVSPEMGDHGLGPIRLGHDRGAGVLEGISHPSLLHPHEHAVIYVAKIRVRPVPFGEIGSGSPSERNLQVTCFDFPFLPADAHADASFPAGPGRRIEVALIVVVLEETALGHQGSRFFEVVTEYPLRMPRLP